MPVDTKTKVAVARSKLRDNFPFFGVLASELNIAEDRTGQVGTACISKFGNMLYNANFVNSLSFNEVMGLVAHEALHVVFEFWDRVGTRVFERCNLAHDYVINLIIHRAGLKLPPGGALDARYEGMSFEEVYEQLPCSEASNIVLLGDVSLRLGELANEHFPIRIGQNPVTRDSEQRDRWKGALMRAVKADSEESSRSIQGLLPGSIQILIEEILYPQLPFADRLQQYIGAWGKKSQPTFRRFNRMNCFEPLHAIVPAYVSNRGRAYLLLDTSGSMFDQENIELLQHGLGCLESIATSIGMDVVTVTCDAELQQRLELREVRQLTQEKRAKLFGGGGSNFTDAFELIWCEIARLRGGAPVICFTDGAIRVPHCQSQIKTDTFWVTGRNHNPPTTQWGIHCPL